MRIWLVLFTSLLLVGCNSTNSANHKNALNVALEADLDEVAVWEPITLTSTVTEHDQPVTEAVVEIEIKDENGQSVGILNAEHLENGMYTLQTVLDVPGTYEITSHVTLGEHHSMPNIEIVVVE